MIITIVLTVLAFFGGVLARPLIVTEMRDAKSKAKEMIANAQSLAAVDKAKLLDEIKNL